MDAGRGFPRQANPSPDRLGNPGVWSFLRSATLAHEPATYTLLPESIDNRFGFPGLEGWRGTAASG